jgi:hypothetical protein
VRREDADAEARQVGLAAVAGPGHVRAQSMLLKIVTMGVKIRA